MHKLGIVSAATVVLLAGAASAQQRPGDQGGAPAGTFAVEGIALGTKIKTDGPTLRDYKCSPSDQFDGLTWCQRTRHEGSVESSYSLAHAKNGTVFYVNRRQQPAVLDARAADRDIQGYARKFGGQPHITKMPRHAGADALIATWGQVALEPLDPEGVKVLGEGRSPKRGLLIDFVGNFTRSAKEGLPIYRIVGGPGFIWAGSFEQKGRGTLRLVAVDASALQPKPEINSEPPPAAALQADVQQPPRSVPSEEPPAPDEPAVQSPPAPAAATPSPSPQPASPPEPPSSANQAAVTAPAEPPSAPAVAEPSAPPVEARRDAEAVTRLQAELSAAVEAKAQADSARARAETARAQAEAARTRAEKVAQDAKADAESARRKLDAVRSDAAAASSEVDRLRAGGGPPVSYTKITLIWLCITGGLLLVLWACSKAVAWYRRAREAAKVHVGEVIVPPTEREEEDARFDENYLVQQMARSLGVEEEAAASQEPPAMDGYRRATAIDRLTEPQSDASGEVIDDVVEVICLPDQSSPIPGEPKSIVPGVGDGDSDREKAEPSQSAQTTPAK